jgi:hypothetical protein
MLVNIYATLAALTPLKPGRVFAWFYQPRIVAEMASLRVISPAQ